MPKNNTKPPRLPELLLIDKIEVLEAAYASKHGKLPINVSHWDASLEITRKLSSLVKVPRVKDITSYRYSYLINEKQKEALLKRLGFRSDKATALITENGTTSITAVVNWLKLRGIREVLLLRPCYFTTSYNLERFGITVREITVPRVMGGVYTLPANIKINKDQALWLTNPVYNTGAYFPETSIKQLVRMIRTGATIIADEALALTPSNLGTALQGHESFVGIYTPHKSICMNGLKFSAVVFHPTHMDTFEDWADVISGGLGVSAIHALEHFLSPSFKKYQRGFLNQIEKARIWHNDLLLQYGNRVQTDSKAKGHFLSLYIPHIEAKLGYELRFLEQIIEATGCTLIPGTRSGFDPARGFCFRINLAQDSRAFRASLKRLYRHLHNYEVATAH